MTWQDAALWWRREEPDLPIAELARMLGVPYSSLYRTVRVASAPNRSLAEQARVDDVKAAVRSGLGYDALAERFGWPH